MDSRREVQPVVEVRALIKELENQRDKIANEAIRAPAVMPIEYNFGRRQGIVIGYDQVIGFLNNLLTEERQGK